MFFYYRNIIQLITTSIVEMDCTIASTNAFFKNKLYSFLNPKIIAILDKEETLLWIQRRTKILLF